MTLRAQVGVGVAVIVLAVVVAGLLYSWKRPLSVYAMTNRRALARAGLAEVKVPSAAGPQAAWTGGSGPTLVLLHGAGDSSGTFAKIADTLATKYHLVIPDLAGHGRSAPAEGPIALGQVLAGLDAVMQQAPSEPATLVGNSLGAWVALLYARQHPERVARVVLVNGVALTGERSDLSLMPKSREEAAALMTELRDPGSQPVPGFVLDDVVREAASGPLARFAQTASGMGEFLLDGKLHEIAAPVDLLWGESDKLFPLSYARRMMSALPASRLTPVPACGHVPQQECPSRFGKALLEVLVMPPPGLTPKPATPAGPESSVAPASGPGR